VAEEVSRVAAAADRNVFTCWVGGESMHEARRIAAEHGVLSNDSPERVVSGYLAILDYRRNRELLLQMPPSQPEGYATDTAGAHAVIAEALASGATVLPPRLARRLLQAYGIEAAEYVAADSVKRAIEVANGLGYPVDLGLALGGALPFAPFATGLRSPAEIQSAVRRLRGDLRAAHPGMRIGGYRLRRATARSGVAPLRAGVAEDPVFGPIIYCGPSAAGSGQESSVAVGLPPLNLVLARKLVESSRLVLGVPPATRARLEEVACRALVRLSQLLTDIDEVVGIELDPVHVEATGAVALEATVRIEKRVRRLGLRRFAIRPYPKELEHRVDWNGRHILVRPIRPEDEQTLADLLNSLSAEDSRMRFFDTMRKLPRSQLARFTQIDYDREMALVAIEADAQGRERSLGEVRAVADPDHVVAEFAIVVDSSLKGQGLGRLLMERIIEYARSSGLGELRGETLAGNQRMQRLAHAFGFAIEAGDDPGTVALRLHLPGGHHPATG
jgi:acetyltransferase